MSERHPHEPNWHVNINPGGGGGGGGGKCKVQPTECIFNGYSPY